MLLSNLVINKGEPIYIQIKRYISNTLETIIAKKMIAGEISAGAIVVVDGKDDNIEVSTK